MIANLFGQVEPGADTRLPLLVSAIDSLKEQMIALKMTSVAFPYLIGAGIGGGNHYQIMNALVTAFNLSGQDATICLKSEIYWNKKTGLSPVFEVWTEAFKQGVKDAGCFCPVKMKDYLDNGWSTTNKHVPLLTVWFGGYACGREFGKKHIGEVHV